MNDLIWYSRFAVLVGALVLFVQAFVGRAQGTITFLALLLLCFGFLVFIGALSAKGWQARNEPAPASDAETPETETYPEEPESGVVARDEG